MSHDGGSRLHWLTTAEQNVEQLAMADAIVNGARRGGNLADEQGRLRGPFNAMLHAPAIGNPLQQLGAAIRFQGSLGDRTREAACLVVATYARCEFERVAHRRIGLAIGLTEPELDAVLQMEIPPTLSPSEAASVRFALDVAQSGALADSEYESYRVILGEQTMFELVTLVGYYRLLADVMSIFGVPT